VGAVGAPVLVAATGLATACAASEGCTRRVRTGTGVDELVGLGLLYGASRAMVEAIAASVVTVPITAGTTIITEGEPADDLYVIRAGTFSAATRTQGTLRLMTVGDWFGEIGVLERRPRTATVAAETEGELWRIPGEAFLHAMSSLTVLPDPLHRGVTSRLVLSGAS